MHYARSTVALLAIMAGCGRYGFDNSASGDGDGGGGGALVDAANLRDAGSTLDGASDPAERCPDIPGVLVCSGFEDDVDEWLFETERQGQITSACPTPRTGQGCLVATSQQGRDAARGVHMYTPVGSGMLYARAWMLVEAGVAIEVINVLSLDALDSGVFGMDLNILDNDRFHIYMQEDDVTSGSIGPVPLGSWFCMHAALLVADSAGTVAAGYGSSAAQSSNVDTFPNAPYDMIALGIDWSSNTQAPITVMVDDVVVATSPLPCP